MKCIKEIEVIDIITTDEEFQELAQMCADKINGITDFEFDEEYYQSEARFNFEVDLYDDLTIVFSGQIEREHDSEFNLIKKTVGIDAFIFVYNDDVLQICKFNGGSSDDFIMLIEKKLKYYAEK